MSDADTDRRQGIEELIAVVLDERELTYRREGAGRFTVTLPGVRKLETTCLLTVGAQALRVEAFVCRAPDEAHEQVYRYLLRKNARLYGVHYSIDTLGDIYLIGRIGLSAVDEEELDRVLGQVLETADGDFNLLLEIGFASAIRREFQWRTSRGESTRNLAAFDHLFRDPDPG
ncbi:YbjN domain-containing protein [Actinoalloteichus fjordicus]|uniref:Bacterial sensory transduction regulator n=1 Tax=Actinoalloteichus fjordicus TaxID=1612552 RepID=A0AAC9PQ35_9PSEU|nr:Putative bacterial sensory transduction regulator [Actinoalloteichus fjordicus]APU18486.1 Putative bacterial sensory transduction regulator [Actinoalloteichus sp. GBA129-24]